MYKYLALPAAATGMNLLLAVLLLPKSTSRASAANLIPARHEGGISESLTCADSQGEETCMSPSMVPLNDTVGGPVPAARDPHLRQMPGVDFKAYVPPDVSEFYKEAPGSRTAAGHKFNGQAGKFINMTPDRLGLYWDSGRGGPGHFSGTVNGFSASGTATFPGHVFFLGKTSDPADALCKFVVQPHISVYYCDPYSESRGELARAHAYEKRDISELKGRDLEMYSKHLYNLQFMDKYKEFTGNEWLAFYPRDPPRHKIWPADYFGQEHRVQTSETQFVTMPPWEELRSYQLDHQKRKESDDIPLRQYRSPEPTMEITLTAVSCAPRIFEIQNFISHTEADHILMLTNRTHDLRPSTTGDSRRPSDHDNTRTSLNTWVDREESPIIDAIYRRVADLLEMDEALLRKRTPEEHPELGSIKGSIAEPLQMVHYEVGQEYTAHHDFGYSQMSDPYEPSRSINVLLYLNDVEEGGETSFPRWMNAETMGSLDVKPEKGKAVLFYMLLPDGNSDDLTQHAALPVIKGEKWMSNLWIWDPFKS